MAAAAVAIWPLQRYISERMEYLKNEVIAFLEESTGREIRYDSVSPSVLRFLEINRMRILSEGGDGDDILEIEKFRIYYNIFKLIGKNPGGAFSRVSIEDSSIAIDLVEDKDFVDLIQTLIDQFRESRAQEFNLVLSGRNMNVSVKQNDARVLLSDLFFDINSRSETPEIDLSGEITCVLPQFENNFENLHAALTLEGNFTRTFSEATLKPSISELHIGDFIIASQTFQLSFSNGNWRITKIQDRLPLDISATFDQTNRAAEVFFAAADFVPESVVRYGGEIEKNKLLQIAMRTNFTGGGEIRYDIDTNSVSYAGTADVSLSEAIGPFSGISASGNFNGNLERVALSDFTIDTDQGSALLNGESGFSPFLPEGTVWVRDLIWPLDRRISGRLEIAGTSELVSVTSDTVQIGAIGLESVSATILPGEDALVFETAFTVGKGESNKIRAEGSVIAGESPEFEISDITIREIRLLLLADLADIDLPQNLPESVLGLKIDADAFLQTSNGRYLFSIPEFKAYGEDGESMVVARIAGNNNNVTVSDFGFTMGSISISGEAAVDTTDSENLGIQGSLTMFDIAYGVEGVLQDRKKFSFSGDYGLTGVVLIEDSELSVELNTKNLPIPYGEITYLAALHIAGSYINAESWRIESQNSTFGPVTLPVLGELRAGFTGVVTPNLITADEIRISDQYSELSGGGYLEYDLSEDTVLKGEVYLANDADGEGYSADFTVSGTSIDAEISIEDGMLQRVGTLPVDGRINAKINANGDLSFPDIAASVSLEEGTFAGDSLAVSADITLNEKLFSVSDLNLDYVTNRIQNGAGLLDFTDGSFSVTGGYSGSFRDRRVTSDLVFSGSFTEAFPKEEIASLVESDFKAEFRAGNIVFGDERPDDWNFSAERAGEILSVNGGPESAMSFVTKSDNSFTIDFKAPLPIVATARGVLSGGEIDAELIVQNLDMEGMESILVIPFFNITSGQAYGSLLISGRLNDPEIYGDLFGRELLAGIQVVPETIGPFTAQLSFKGKSLLINKTLLPAGAAEVYGTAEFTLDHWLPTTYEIQLTTASAPGIHIRNNFGKVDTDGYGHGELFISGDPFAIELTGELVVSNGSVIIGQPPPAGNGGTPLIADITLVSGKKVVFLWPNRNVPILTAYADTGQKVRIQTNPVIGSLDIDGEVGVKSGEVFYFQRSFRIREGSVLLEEDQNEVDPRISVRAESRDVTDAGEELRIYLVIENQPFSQFKPRFESVPPLSQTEIYAALGQNLRDEFGGDFYGLSSALLITSDIFSQFAVVRSLEQRVRDLLNLDLFSVRTYVLQNVLSEQLIPADAAFVPTTASAGRYLDNTTLFLGKYFGNDIFLEAMVRLRTNQALLSNLDAGDDLYVDSEIRLEWKTPLFLLELSLLPDILDPLSSIQRARLGLSWDIWY